MALDNVTVTPVPPLLVTGQSVTIPDGDTSPSTDDDTQFNDMAVCGGTPQTHEFTIHNQRNTDLTITVPITLTGSSDFTVTTQPGLTTIPAGGQTTFSITFTPTNEGTSAVVVSINSSQTSGNPYTFTLQGNGVSPEIEVSGNSNPITSGSTPPSVGNGTDFGTGSPVTQTYTITNSTTATDNLDLSGIVIGGAHPGDFSFTAPLDNSLAPGETTTFTVTYAPLSTGVSFATVTISSDDCDEGSFQFDIQGATEDHCEDDAEIGVTGLGQPIRDGSASCSLGNGTAFANVLAGQVLEASQSFTITNSGTSFLVVNDISISPAGGAFTVTPALTNAAAVAPGDSMTFLISFLPGTVGAHTATVTIDCNDSDESEYSFTVCGRGVKPKGKPKMKVSGLGIDINNGDSTPNVADDTNFGTVSQNHVHEFKIRNGNNLSLLQITKIELPSNLNQGGCFTLLPLPPLPSQASPWSIPGTTFVPFQVLFTPPATASFLPQIRSAVIRIYHNDQNELPYYEFKITARYMRQFDPIDWIARDRRILNGDKSPSLKDHTSFGKVRLTGKSVTRTYTIRNKGDTPVTLGRVRITGSGLAPDEFTVIKQPSASLEPGKSTKCRVSFDPSARGPRDANLSLTVRGLANLNAGDKKYQFKIRGYGIPDRNAGTPTR